MSNIDFFSYVLLPNYLMVFQLCGQIHGECIFIYLVKVGRKSGEYEGSLVLG